MNRWFSCVFTFLFTLPAVAGEAAAHVHGVASLQVAIDGSSVTLTLESPLDNLLGFEHAARSEQERATVRAMRERLEQVESLFVPSPAARCQAVSVRLESPVLQTGSRPANGGHADLDGEFVFHCQNPGELHALEVTMFRSFPNLQRLDVQVASPRGQSAARLSPQQRRVTW